MLQLFAGTVETISRGAVVYLDDAGFATTTAVGTVLGHSPRRQVVQAGELVDVDEGGLVWMPVGNGVEA